MVEMRIPIAEVAYEYVIRKQYIDKLEPRERSMRLGQRWQSMMPSPLT